MTITVTAHVFSGRPDPVWTIPEPKADEFRQKVGELVVSSNLKAIDGRGGLGYRGFSVLDHSGLFSSRIFNGIVDRAHDTPSLIATNKALEIWLLQTAGDSIGAAVTQHIRDSLSSPVTLDVNNTSLDATAEACPKCFALDAPPYNPAIWNTPTSQPFNNCYNYANNRMTNTFAQPGRATGKPIASLTCGGVNPSAVSDGLRNTPNFVSPLGHGQGYYVALVIWPNQDYHWYRQDKIGCWSHKPGSTIARNVDNSGNAVSDPATASRGPYTSFCNYMISTPSVKIS